jgi:hypothetical protein|tara:strand:- start:1209 stop:1586 length:378 start_codon:yes stop_codon:yes gene_type:complete
MGTSAGNTDLGELMRSYGLDGNVPVYRSPQTFPGIMGQTQAPQGNPYGQLSGYPTIRPYPFQDPRFQFDNPLLTPLSTKEPIVPTVSTQVQQNKNRQPGAKQQNSLGQKQIRRREDMPNFMGNIR